MLAISRRIMCEQYDVGGISLTIAVLKRGLEVRTGEIRTTEELTSAVGVITDAAAERSSFTRDELYNDVQVGEVPHASKLLEFNQTIRLGFDITNRGLGFFVEHKGDLSPEQDLEMLQAPGDHYMSRSDHRRVRKIQKMMASR